MLVSTVYVKLMKKEVLGSKEKEIYEHYEKLVNDVIEIAQKSKGKWSLFRSI